MEMVKVFLYLKGEVCSLLPKLRQFLAVKIGFLLPFSEYLFSKWKDLNFFVFTTPSQKMIVHLSDRAENCLEGHKQPISLDFEGTGY